MSEDACILDGVQRELVAKTIHEHCRIRHWILHAVNCRTNHLHVVVTADRLPDEVRVQFKSWCTRRLKDLERQRQRTLEPIYPVREHWWAERGSRRFINDDESLTAAILYVRDYQDHPR
jgi:hypothetical protein